MEGTPEMRTIARIIAALLVIGPVVAGCDQEPETTASTPAAEPTAPSQAPDTAAPAPSDETLKARAFTALLREKVVALNEAIIRERTQDMDQPAIERFVNATVNELSQCSGLRAAQAVTYRAAGREDAKAYETRSSELEAHLYLFVRATGRLFEKPDLEAGLREDLKSKAQTIVQQHRLSLGTDRTDEQTAELAAWEERCSNTESVLKTDVERRAKEQVTPEEIAQRVQTLQAAATDDTGDTPSSN